MTSKGHIDPILHALGSRGKYQMLQFIMMLAGAFGATYQILGNIFIGRDVTQYQCSTPASKSVIPAHLQDVDWNSSQLVYSKCQITVNHSLNAEEYDCLFGYTYGYSRELSFRTEFDLVCGRSFLGGLAQSFVIMGQGVGAVLASIVSDRYGRKKVLVGSQFGLLALGMGIGLSPSYPVLGTLKFLAGGLQQGVITAAVTMSIELYPWDIRHLTLLGLTAAWAISCSSMALVAYLMREYSWRYLQYALSAASIIGFLQLWYLDESFRWLVANGKKEEVLKVLRRAALTNGKNLQDILPTLGASHGHEEERDSLAAGHSEKECQSDITQSQADIVQKILRERQSKQLSVLDIFRHKWLTITTLIIWFAWCTCVFSYFALYMMSTTLHGNRFLNYFMTSIMELPPAFILFLLINRVGRKAVIWGLYLICGIGLVSCGIFRIFADNAVLASLSVAASMLGMAGASGIFNALFFYTPEVFPTNMRNQVVGLSSCVGRLGGVLAPFMTSLAQIAVWAPGAMIGILCFIVVFLWRFLPETKGRELPQKMADVRAMYKPVNESEKAENYEVQLRV